MTTADMQYACRIDQSYTQGGKRYEAVHAVKQIDPTYQRDNHTHEVMFASGKKGSRLRSYRTGTLSECLLWAMSDSLAWAHANGLSRRWRVIEWETSPE